MDKKKVIDKLNQAIELELTGAMWYLATSFNVFGLEREEFNEFLREQMSESIGHATKLGEKIVDLGGAPVIKVGSKKPAKGSLKKILQASLEHEQKAVDHYSSLLKDVTDDVVMDAFAREFIVEESKHVAEVEKMLREM